MKYISKGEWFDVGTEAYLIDDYKNGSGLFRGIRTCENPDSEARKFNEKYLDEEICEFAEFNIIE